LPCAIIDHRQSKHKMAAWAESASDFQLEGVIHMDACYRCLLEQELCIHVLVLHVYYVTAIFLTAHAHM